MNADFNGNSCDRCLMVSARRPGLRLLPMKSTIYWRTCQDWRNTSSSSNNEALPSSKQNENDRHAAKGKKTAERNAVIRRYRDVLNLKPWKGYAKLCAEHPEMVFAVRDGKKTMIFHFRNYREYHYRNPRKKRRK
jgi:hypothetical protein